jgi:tetratricopeptide (TPR) repeat protein
MLARMEATARHDPPSASLLEIAGRLYDEHGWHGDAQRALREAIEADPQRSTAAAALARSYLNAGRFEAALRAAAKADDITAAFTRAVLAEQKGNLRAVIAEYESALRHGDRSGLAANNIAWLLAQQDSQLDRALELARIAHDQDPDNPAIVDTIGFVQMEHRQYSDAVQSLKMAANMAGAAHTANLPTIRAHLAQACALAGDSDGACRR